MAQVELAAHDDQRGVDDGLEVRGLEAEGDLELPEHGGGRRQEEVDHALRGGEAGGGDGARVVQRDQRGA
jgi:hypothetical protein